MVVEPGLYGTWSETPKTGFLTTRLTLFLSDLTGCDVDGAVQTFVQYHSAFDHMYGPKTSRDAYAAACR